MDALLEEFSESFEEILADFFRGMLEKILGEFMKESILAWYFIEILGEIGKIMSLEVLSDKSSDKQSMKEKMLDEFQKKKLWKMHTFLEDSSESLMED